MPFNRLLIFLLISTTLAHASDQKMTAAGQFSDLINAVKTPSAPSAGNISSVPAAEDTMVTYHIQDISFKGNILTRNRTILREIPFAEGDSVPSAKLDSKVRAGRLNLMNTGLFNFVEAEISLEGTMANITYHFVERWNIWPLPVLELEGPNLNQWLDNPSFSAFNYGISLKAGNLSGLNERIRLEAKAGNVQSLNIQLTSPFFGTSQFFRAELQYTLDRSRSRAYNTEDNKQLVARVPDEFISNEYLFSGSLRFRPAFYNTYRVGFSFHYHNYADTLLTLNPRFGPDGESRFSFFSASYSFSRDRRDRVAYPLHGYLIEAGITRKGLSFLGDKDMDITSLHGEIRRYTHLVEKWYGAWSIYGKWNEGTTLSYFDREGLGFNRSLVRGYEDYVVDGHKFLIFKSNLKYNLLPEQAGEISFVPTEKFSKIHYALYLNIFADIGIINDRHFHRDSNLSNRLLAATGIGLDFHTYYDMVLRSELSLNRHGEAGLFFHFAAPI